MGKHVWATSADGAIDYISLTPEYLEKCLEVLRKSYYIEETCCKSTGLSKNDKAMSEVDSFVKYLSNFGVSIIAVERETDVVCGIAINQIHQASERTKEETVFKKFEKAAKEEPTRKLMKCFDEADLQFNIFEDYSVDCYMEILLLVTLKEFRRKGIAFKLCQVSEEVVKQLTLGKNVKQPIDKEHFTPELIPRAICAVFSSSKSQSLGRKLGWEIGNSNITFENLDNDFVLQIKKF